MVANPHTPAEHMAQIMSRIRADRLQRAINPKNYDYVTEDKGIFYHYCIGANIRIPRLYAIFDPSLGWTPDGKRLGHKDDWDHFFREDVPDAFVIKPTWGVHGQSVYVFTRDHDSFLEFSGKRYSVGQSSAGRELGSR